MIRRQRFPFPTSVDSVNYQPCRSEDTFHFLGRWEPHPRRRVLPMAKVVPRSFKERPPKAQDPFQGIEFSKFVLFQGSDDVVGEGPRAGGEEVAVKKFDD